ncbi:MAG: hypothetical protein LAT82_00910 [Nanoarchaeota archaeon]|nr:hypothetical protein [Nanoarchaeota archaeon]
METNTKLEEIRKLKQLFSKKIIDYKLKRITIENSASLNLVIEVLELTNNCVLNSLEEECLTKSIMEDN